MATHQLVPTLTAGDAISQQACTLRGMLREIGENSEIFAAAIDPRLADVGRPLEELEAGPGDRLLYHFSIGSPATDRYRASEARRILLYHNITPPEFFVGVNDRVARNCEIGRRELADLRGATEEAWADSEFNRRELADLGFAETHVFPILLDPARFDARPDAAMLRAYGDGKKNLLHVGRIVPNKKIEDLLKAFYFLKRKIRPDVRLVLAGVDTDMELYAFALREMARDLGLADVDFLGGVEPSELTSLYRRADVYVCASEHEGFCAPLVEAMSFGVPVVAHASTAVPETLADAGVLVREKDPVRLAELLDWVLERGDRVDELVERGRERASRFLPAARRDELAALLRRS